MKGTIKIIFLTLIGLVTAVVIYPFLHEAGHVIATVIGGGRCKEFNLFPLPNVLCDVSQLSDQGMVLIGLSGLGLPIIVSIFLHSKNFYLWYAELLLKGITLLSICISTVIIILSQFGVVIQKDDITQVLQYWSGGYIPILIFMILAFVWIAVKIIRERPINRIAKELC